MKALRSFLSKDRLKNEVNSGKPNYWAIPSQALMKVGEGVETILYGVVSKT
jgi:hypothetical protein